MPKQPAHTKYSTGHRPHMTGGGVHDSRPNRARQRGQAEAAAITAELDGVSPARKGTMTTTTDVATHREAARRDNGEFGTQQRTAPLADDQAVHLPNLTDDQYSQVLSQLHALRAGGLATVHQTLLCDARLTACAVLDQWPDARSLTFARNGNPYVDEWEPVAVTLADGTVVERDEERLHEEPWREFSEIRSNSQVLGDDGFIDRAGDRATWRLDDAIRLYDRESPTW